MAIPSTTVTIMSDTRINRRKFILSAGCIGTGLLVNAATGGDVFAAEKEKGVKAVTANEDLMREHGVLRRIVLVYRQTAVILRRDASSVDPRPLHRAARLFRTFGEDYHEKRLEEAHIFPAIRKTKGKVAAYPDILEAQHDRGREITKYILSVTGKERIGTGNAEPLSRAFDNMNRMYANHTAREDTVVFPAWKKALSAAQYKDMGETFEEIERQQFGHDAFEDAVKQIADIEQALGYADLTQFTAPPA